MLDEKQMKTEKRNKKIKMALGTITIIGGIGLAAYGLKEYKENNNPFHLKTSWNCKTATALWKLQGFYKILVMVLHGACNTITRVE